MLDNVMYVLALVLPLAAAWAYNSHTKLLAQQVIEKAMTDRTRLNIEDANTRAKTAEYEQALTNALTELEDHNTQIAELRAEMAEQTKQVSLLTERL
jgi:predicted  nucleic acid-binding Zn-ribbon protein